MSDVSRGTPPPLRLVPGPGGSAATGPGAPGPVAPAPGPVGRWAAILGGRCPRCRRGRIFASAFRMNRDCPHCGLVFEREPGYFVGAMYVSYALGIPTLGLLVLLVRLVRPGTSLGHALVAAGFLFLPLVPLVFRSSRVVWIHVDRAIDRDS